MKVMLLYGSSSMLSYIGARRCYSKKASEEIMQDALKLHEDKLKDYLDKVRGSGHTSVLEHTVFTFAIDGVSRALLAQLTRHRIGISFSVQSQRYCSMEKLTGDDHIWYHSENKDIENEYRKAIQDAIDHYNTLIALGEVPEKARRVSTQAAPTSIIMTINAAELIHVAGLRCCVRAEEEIRELFFEICRLVKHEAPELFSNLGPFCKMHGYCPEGERGCGRYPTIDELVKVYNRIKAVRGYSGD